MVLKIGLSNAEKTRLWPSCLFHFKMPTSKFFFIINAGNFGPFSGLLKKSITPGVNGPNYFCSI